MKKHLLMLAIASACMASLPAAAQVTAPAAPAAMAQSNDQHRAQRDQIEADYKAAKAQCDTLQANAKDVCEKEAKGTEKIAKAELEQQRNPSERHARKVAEEKNDATYEVAKEKCDDQKGDAKSACVKQAKADHDRGKADIKAAMAVKR